MGIPPSPGSLSKAPRPARSGAASPLSSALALFVYGGPGLDVFYFHRLFIGTIFFFLFFFIFWPGGGGQRRKAHRLVSSASSRPSALSLVCAPLASLLSLLSPLASPSFQLRPQSTALSRLYCLPLLASPFPILLTPSPLFLFLFTSSASLFLPIPRPPSPQPRTSLLWFPGCHRQQAALPPTSPPNNKNTQPGGKAPTPGAGREARGPRPQRRRAAGARCGASGARPAPARRALCNRPSRLH